MAQFFCSILRDNFFKLLQKCKCYDIKASFQLTLAVSLHRCRSRVGVGVYSSTTPFQHQTTPKHVELRIDQICHLNNPQNAPFHISSLIVYRLRLREFIIYFKYTLHIFRLQHNPHCIQFLQ